MKHALVVLLAVALAAPPALPVAADERQVKKQLIAELLEVIDTKTLTQASFDVLFNRLSDDISQIGDMELDEEAKKQFEANVQKQRDEMNAFRQRLLLRIDYARYAEEIYAPVFDATFTADELRELIVFYKTKAGQKSARMLPELAVGGMVKGMKLLDEEARKIEQEMQQEARNKNPLLSTMADLRSLATALEAYATDEEAYPKVSSVDDLKPILSPTYIRTLPTADGWGTEFSYASDGTHYRLASAGADKKFEWNAKQIEKLPEGHRPRFIDSDDADIIYQDGNFVQAPQKSQSER